jgi:hypothetical protein
MRLEKDLYVTDLRISRVANQPFIIEAVGRYVSRITLNEASLAKFAIEPSKDLVGSNIVVTIQPRKDGETGPHDVLLSRMERIDRRRIHQIPKISFIDETEYRAIFYTPKKNPASFAIPCPNYELKLDLTEAEYQEILSIDPSTVFSVSCRTR